MPPDLLTGQLITLRRGVQLQVAHQSGRVRSGSAMRSPAWVFLHGGLGNRFNWRSQYEFAAAQGWEVLAYDLAGHGQSPPYPRYSIGRHCRDLTRLLDRFQIQAPILCCHSYGVPIGLEWAQRHAVSGLVLIAGGTHDLDPWWEVPLMKLLTWGGRHLYRLPAVRQMTQKLSSSHQHDRLDRFFAESPVPINAEPYRALEIFWGYNFFDRHPHSNAAIPTLVISGGQDSMFDSTMGEALAAQFHYGQHLHISTGGHLLMAEYSEQVNEAIAQFIAKFVCLPS